MEMGIPPLKSKNPIVSDPLKSRLLFWLAAIWLRTNGVNTNGAAAKVMNFDRLGKKVRHGYFGKIKVG